MRHVTRALALRWPSGWCRRRAQQARQQRGARGASHMQRTGAAARLPSQHLTPRHPPRLTTSTHRPSWLLRGVSSSRECRLLSRALARSPSHSAAADCRPPAHSYNKFTSIAARATRQALKEEERVKAERRGELSLRYQEWKDGKAGDHVSSAQGPGRQRKGLGAACRKRHSVASHGEGGQRGESSCERRARCCSASSASGERRKADRKEGDMARMRRSRAGRWAARCPSFQASMAYALSSKGLLSRPAST